MQTRDELVAINAGETVRVAYATMRKWKAVEQALGTPRSTRKPAVVKQPPPANRAARRRQKKITGGFKKEDTAR